MRIALLPLALTLGALLAPLPAAGVASDWAVNGPSRVRLLSQYRVAPADASGVWLGLHFRLQPDWHVYWKNSGDAGYPPTLSLSGSAGKLDGELLWPAPRRFELRGGLVAFGYADEVVYPVRARLATGAAAGSRERLSADLDYLVCQVDCIPFHSRLIVDQPLGAPEDDPETAPLLAAARSRLPLLSGSLPGVTAETAFAPGAQPALTVRIRPVTGAPAGADLFLEPQETFETGKPSVLGDGEDGSGLLFRVPLVPRQVGPLPATFTFAWTATGLLHEGRPLALTDRRTVALTPAALPTLPAPPPGDGLVRTLGLALLAVLSTLLALGLWGLLGGQPSPGRQALGFLAALGTVLLLYALSRSVRSEGLAAVELALLGMALLAWLRRTAAGGSKLSRALVVALGLAAGAALGLAVLSRIP
jgi:DsbC/DsbD-like thiol-disulfide interchange protein